ncbi:BMP family ABC transporter substrate-binding protein [Desulfobacterales bacterium HSG17]|nr:BMP family ABC transporter substrate-binding protein [Desulfobacterales bacterium HSG17]
MLEKFIAAGKNIMRSKKKMEMILLAFLLMSIPKMLMAFKPVVVFDTSKLDDKSFIGAAYNGVLSFEKFKSIEVAIITPDNDKMKLESGFDRLVTKAIEKGFDPIVCIGFSFGSAIRELAPKHPDKHFIIIDDIIEAENVQSIVFREEEGSFLMGYIAAMVSKTGKIGFVGGMDCEMIRKFGCAYAQGALQYNSDIQVRVVMTGTTSQAWVDPDRGYALTRELIQDGIDVVFHAAGLTGTGVIRAAADTEIYAIGVDSNQNSLAPGFVLTSMLKRLDVVVFTALSQAADRAWQSGYQRLGLKEGAISWALDKHNIVLVNQAMQTRMDALSFKIISDQIDVHVYKNSEACPYYNFGPYAAE